MKKKIYELTPLEKLQEVARMVGVQHVDICPEYSAFIECVYGVVNSCGESGFDALWDICSQHPDMTREKLRKTFDACSRSTRHGNSIGTLLYHARQAGVTFGREWGEAEFANKTSASHSAPSTSSSAAVAAAAPIASIPCTHAYDSNNPQNTMNSDNDLTISNELISDMKKREEEAKHRPPLLPVYRWPDMLMTLMDCGQSDGQRDVILLSTLCVVGSTVGKLLGFEYGQGDTRYSCLQVFIVGEPASGKSAMMLARRFAEPLNGKMLAEHKKLMGEYELEHNKWMQMGKQKMGVVEPKQPPLRMFIIPGNNSASGMISNLGNNGGLGLMIESEASVIGGTYRQDWGDYSAVPRIAFDHDPLMLHRLTNNEFKMVEKVYLSMLISGTPGQVAGIARSRENGQLSRQVYYHIFQEDDGWKNQWNREKGSANKLFVRLGKRWEMVRAALEKEVSSLEFNLSREQQDEFNTHFASLYAKAGNDEGTEGQSIVARLAINLLRMMSIETLLRVFDGLLMDEARAISPEAVRGELMQSELAVVPADVSSENALDRITPRWELHISEPDFQGMLSLAESLYEHAVYTLSLIPKEEVHVSEKTPAERFRTSLPVDFELKEAYALGAEFGIKESTVRGYLARLVKKKVLENVSGAHYHFVAKMWSSEKKKRVSAEDDSLWTMGPLGSSDQSSSADSSVWFSSAEDAKNPWED
jgi:hypothetical protein